MKGRFMSSAFWNLAGFLASTGIMLLTIPYIVRTLGLENYGIFGLINAFVAPVGLIGLGIAPSIIRGVASHRDGDFKSRETTLKYVQTGTAVSILIGTVGGVIIAMLGPWLFATIFPKLLISRTVLVLCFAFVGVQWFSNQLCGTWSAAAIGLQEYRYTAIGQTTQNMLITGMGVSALWLGFGLVGYVLAVTLARTLMVGYWMCVTAKLLRMASLFPKFEFEIAKSSIRFGAWFSLAEIGKILGTEAQQYIAGLLLGPAAVGVFNITNRVMTTMYSVNGKILEVLFPHFSSQAHLPAENRLKNLMLAVGGCSLISTATMGPLAAVAFPLLELWMNPKIALQGHRLLQLLCLGGLFISLSGPVYFFLLADGKSRVTASISLLVGSTMAGVSFLLTPYAGLAGIGMGFAISGFFTIVFYIIALARLKIYRSYHAYRLFAAYALPPLFASVLVFLATLPLVYLLNSWLTIIMAYCTLSCIIFFSGALFLQICDRFFGMKLSPLKIILNSVNKLALLIGRNFK